MKAKAENEIEREKMSKWKIRKKKWKLLLSDKKEEKNTRVEKLFSL